MTNGQVCHLYPCRTDYQSNFSIKKALKKNRAPCVLFLYVNWNVIRYVCRLYIVIFIQFFLSQYLTSLYKTTIKHHKKLYKSNYSLMSLLNYLHYLLSEEGREGGGNVDWGGFETKTQFINFCQFNSKVSSIFFFNVSHVA